MSLKNSSFDVQIITSINETEYIQQEWEEFLQKQAVSPSFWQHPIVIDFPRKASNNTTPIIIILRRNNNIECIAPCTWKKTRFTFIFSIFRLSGPKTRLLNIIGSDFLFSRNTNTTECADYMFKILHNTDTWDLISLDNLCTCNNLYKKFKQNNFRIFNLKLSTTSPSVEKIRKHILHKSYDEWISSLKGKTRGKIRRRIRSLYKKFPDQVELKVITSPSHIPDFLQDLNDLFPKTWQAKTFGIRSRNTPQEIRYYEQIAQKKWLRSYLLLVEQKPVAFLVGYQFRGIYYHAECGYDPAFAQLGVGSVLNYLMLKDLYENHKPYKLDFGFGENEYKKILGNESADAFDAYITRPGIWGVIINFQRFLSYAEEKIRVLFQMLKIDKSIRKFLKRK